MVESGLVDELRVSHLRLAARLGLALAIFGAMLWLALGQLRRRPRVQARPDPWLPGLATGITGLIFVQVLSGALAAGTHAGLLYDSFPLMAGSVIPPGLLRLDPWFENPFYNLTTIHFTHRAIAWTLLVAVAAFWRRARTTPTRISGRVRQICCSPRCSCSLRSESRRSCRMCRWPSPPCTREGRCSCSRRR